MGLFRRKAGPPAVPREVELDGVVHHRHQAWSPDPENFFHLYLPAGDEPGLFRRP